MSKKLPYLPVYVDDDVLANTALQTCSLAARGLWDLVRALCWKSPRRGYLYTDGAQPLPLPLLANLAGTDSGTLTALVRELITSGLLAETTDKVLYSPRVQDIDRRQKQARANGSKGGNPLIKGRKAPATVGAPSPLKGEGSRTAPGVNPGVNGGVNPDVEYVCVSLEREEKNTHTGDGGVGEGGSVNPQVNHRVNPLSTPGFDRVKAAADARKAVDHHHRVTGTTNSRAGGEAAVFRLMEAEGKTLADCMAYSDRLAAKAKRDGKAGRYVQGAARFFGDGGWRDFDQAEPCAACPAESLREKLARQREHARRQYVN